MSERDERTLAYLAKVLGEAGRGGGIGAAAGGAGTSLGDIAREAAPTPEMEDLALAGAERTLAGEPPAERERLALEAIVLPRLRPVVDVVAGRYETPPAPWEKLGEPRYRDVVETAILAVGRVDVPSQPAIPYAGTGFVVGRDLLMTNRHVAAVFSTGVGLRELVWKPGFDAAVDFAQEVVPTEPVLLGVEAVAMVHPYWDCALLRVAGLPPERRPLRLAGTEPGDLDDREVAVIGYPARDARNDAALQHEIFRGVFQKKRMMPGRVMGYREWPSFGKDVTALAHDSSTLGGNSGSAVVDLETGRVLALHFAGAYLDANVGVPAWELARDERVRDAGVLFHDPPPFPGPAPWEASWEGLA